MNDTIGTVAIVWRGEAGDGPTPRDTRLLPLFEALAARDVEVRPVVFVEENWEAALEQLRRADGVLVWVDPLMNGVDRSRLDAVLREVSSTGVWVSAHPDVILRMGTKEVLYHTRDLGWGADTHLYLAPAAFRAEFPPRLASSGPRVLKQHRGNGGIGIWKVELVPGTDRAPAGAANVLVRVQHARPRDTLTEELPLVDFMSRCEAYFAGTGRIIDQPFLPRITEGMIRCYMVRAQVAGFSTQSPGVDAGDAAGGEGAPPRNIFGLPAKKTMLDASEPRFASLKTQLESDWIPGMQRLVDVDEDALPMLWDADFLYGPRTGTGADTYVLCEINVSCVSPFPEGVVGQLADAVAARLAMNSSR